MKAKDCHKNNLDWYDVTDEESDRNHLKVEICTNLDCKEDCDRIRIMEATWTHLKNT